MKVYLKTFSDCGAKLVKYFTQMYFMKLLLMYRYYIQNIFCLRYSML